jgi:hypothetical protein
VTRVQILNEAIHSEEYRNRRYEAARAAWQKEGLNVDPQNLLIKSIEWETRVLDGFTAQSAIERCVRLPSDDLFLHVAYRDLIYCEPPKDGNKLAGRVADPRQDRIRVLLEILLSQVCLRRVIDPAAHLQLIRKLAAQIGIMTGIDPNPLSLVSITNRLMTIPKVEWLDRALALIVPEEHSAYPDAIVLAEAVLASQGDPADLTASLVYHVFLHGMVNADNAILRWSVEHLSNVFGNVKHAQDVSVASASISAPVDAFKLILKRCPRDGELKVLETALTSRQSHQTVLAALSLLSYRTTGHLAGEILPALLREVQEFETLSQHHAEIHQLVLDLVDVRAEQPMPPVVQALPASIQLVPPPLVLPQALTNSIDTHRKGPDKSIDELTAYEGERFVRECYLALLQREPDDAGMIYYLGRMKRGQSKRSVIFDMASGKEAKAIGSSLSGLEALIGEQSRLRHWFWGMLARTSGVRSF